MTRLFWLEFRPCFGGGWPSKLEVIGALGNIFSENGWLEDDSFSKLTWSLFKGTWFVVMGVDRIRFLSLQTYTSVFLCSLRAQLFQKLNMLLRSMFLHVYTRFFFGLHIWSCVSLRFAILPTQPTKISPPSSWIAYSWVVATQTFFYFHPENLGKMNPNWLI